MFSAIDTAYSGMNAASAKLNVAASNIANQDSQGYTARRVDLVDVRSGDQGAGVAVAGVTDTGQPVDLATEMVATKQASQMYTANAIVLKTADEMLGTVLDIFDDGKDSSNRRR